MPSSATARALLTVRSPADHRVLAELPKDTPSTIGEKTRAAHKAQALWVKAPLEKRKACLARFRDLLRERRCALAETLAQEMGKPLTQAESEVDATPDRVDYFLQHVEDLSGVINVKNECRVAEALSYEPLGVIAHISAWNYPFFVGTNVLVPALLTGNAVLYKPSEYATLTGLKIGEILVEAGVPQDLCPVIVGDGEVGAWLLDEHIDGCFFTGSHRTGITIAAACSRKLIRSQLELGGKDPAYVRADADIAHACAALADGAFYNAGQSCCAVERIYVHEDVAEAFIEGFLECVNKLRIGPPLKEGVTLGPLGRPEQVTYLEKQVADALNKGAHKLIGGGRMGEEGNFFAATVLVNVDHTMDVMREESFGPIIGIQVVQSDEEALKLMQDTDYGLTASVFTEDLDAGKSLLSRISCGSAYVNCCDRVSPHLPWSGRGHSGIGSTLGPEGIRAFLQPKAWHLATTLTFS